MTHKDASTLERLDNQAARIAEVFEAAGLEAVAPDILQPADVFLDRSGENIRQRAYVFSDLDGAELCLRPDLTVPACRVYLARHPQADAKARYWYRGPAFRYQPIEEPGVTPREFEQMGVELFGDDDAQAAEADVLALAAEALKVAGLKDFVIRMGDLGLFAALADGLDMPARWRERMKQVFWRPKAFRDLLARLAGVDTPGFETGRGEILDLLAAQSGGNLVQNVETLLAARNSPLAGARGLDEIAARLDALARDAREPPLSAEVVAAIEDYLAVQGSPEACLDEVTAIAGRIGLDISPATEACARRLDLARDKDVPLEAAVFSAEFGRSLEYYTGLVFQFELPGLGVAGQIAAGGRYDSLLADIGAPNAVPAVGCAIHTERLAQAVLEAGS